MVGFLSFSLALRTEINRMCSTIVEERLFQDIDPHVAMPSANAVSLKVSQVEGEDFGSA